MGGRPVERPSPARASAVVRGVVQGVGFRPFVSGLARRLGLTGFVRNETHGVRIEVEGAAGGIARFRAAVHAEAPPNARIDSIDWKRLEPKGDEAFVIEDSVLTSGACSFVAPDTATCSECLRELFDPSDRRHGHPFVNCTRCGPRLTIVVAVPYDRERTTMASFAMCDRCRAEYEDPSDRRFHAQPVACPDCGPRVALLTQDGVPIDTPDPIATAARELREGALVLVKGIGGFHLACDATNERAVRALREAKRRDAKPFALMLESIEIAEAYCAIADAERALLFEPARPIVLLRRRADGADRAPAIAPSVAPGQARLGVMLPYSPLHHLLARRAGVPLVMTSGNVTDEPIAFEDSDAMSRLAPMVDCVLTHDRRIHDRCEDSVAHVVDGAPAALRRSRGHAPAPVALAEALDAPVLALGGHLKAVFAVGVRSSAFLSQHFGDLDHVEAVRSFRLGLERLPSLLGVEPEVVVHDLHPEYATSAIALELERRGLRRVAIQHHQAHVAACLAERKHVGPAIGVAFDGAGHGSDGAVWGGEIFVGSLAIGRFERRAHLRYVGLPGGDRAAREPWRMAVAHLVDAGVDDLASLVPAVAAADVAHMQTIAQRPAFSPPTSSVGRLFDAVAALVLGHARVTFEAEAPMALQALAETHDASVDPYPFALVTTAAGTIEMDGRAMLRQIAADVRNAARPALVARRFHETVATMIEETCSLLRSQGAPRTVALCGGVFANTLLAERAVTRLRTSGFHPLLSREVPTGDGGLAYGQLALTPRFEGSG